MVLKSVGVLSCAKIMGAIYGGLGLIGGIFFGLFAIVGALLNQPANNPTPVAVVIGIGLAAVLLIPIFYGILGFVGGIIVAAVYNLVAGMFGGLELEFERPAPPVAQP